MKKLIQSIAVLFLSTLFMTSIVHAATAITYNGKGIRGIQSVQA